MYWSEALCANEKRVKMSGTSSEYKFVQWILDWIDKFLATIGLQGSVASQEFLFFIVVLLISLFIGCVLRRIAYNLTIKLPIFKKTKLGATIASLGTFNSCTLFISPLIFLILGNFAFAEGGLFVTAVQRLVNVYLLLTFAIGVNALLKLQWTVFNSRYNTKNLPLDGVYNMCRGAVWMITAILCSSVLLDKSPISLLAGLGAISAVFLLIFKDTFLGLVATLQLSSNDMIRKGDWIVVDGTSANGVVFDVTLSAVKVKNWDNTTSILSPYKLVSGSFQNYRSMFESGARQIKSAIYVDPMSVKATSAELFKKIADKYPVVAPMIAKALAPNGLDLTNDPLQSGMSTNLGLFRAYLFAYLRANPRIAQDQDLLINLRDETEFGIPIQIYCFSTITKWIPYEQIHDEVLEHAFQAAADFELSLCNYSNYNNTVTMTNSEPGAKAE